MPCAESLRVQAYFDGEVDALSAADIELHMQHCAGCQALFEDLQRLRGALREQLPAVQTPPGLRAQIMRALPPQRRGQTWRKGQFWIGAASGLGAAALAATLAFVLLAPLRTAPVVDELVVAHVNSLLSTHLVDVVSTDRHTVKPWFQGKIPFTFNLPELQGTQFTLLGGRVTYLAQTPGAHLIYQVRKHEVSVFIFQDRGDETASLPSGPVHALSFNIENWTQNGLRYFVVGDVGPEDIRALSKLLRDAA